LGGNLISVLLLYICLIHSFFFSLSATVSGITKFTHDHHHHKYPTVAMLVLSTPPPSRPHQHQHPLFLKNNNQPNPRYFYLIIFSIITHPKLHELLNPSLRTYHEGFVNSYINHSKTLLSRVIHYGGCHLTDLSLHWPYSSQPRHPHICNAPICISQHTWLERIKVTMASLDKSLKDLLEFW